MRFALFACLLFTFECVTGTGLARCDDVRRGGGICVKIGEPFDLRIGETAYIADTRLSIRANAVPEDSRCPRDAVCVWAGNARVALTLRDGPNADDVELNSTLEPRAAIRGAYRIELTDVRPVPSAGVATPAEDYVIQLVANQAND
jgi:hypothetical protein